MPAQPAGDILNHDCSATSTNRSGKIRAVDPDTSTARSKRGATVGSLDSQRSASSVSTEVSLESADCDSPARGRDANVESLRHLDIEVMVRAETVRAPLSRGV